MALMTYMAKQFTEFFRNRSPSSVGVTNSGVSLISLDSSQPLLSQEHCSKMTSSYPLAHGCQIFCRVAIPIRCHFPRFFSTGFLGT